MASIVGQIISMSLAIGPVFRLCTRALYLVLNSCQYCSDGLPLSCASRDELLFGNPLPQPLMSNLSGFPQAPHIWYFLMLAQRWLLCR